MRHLEAIREAEHILSKILVSPGGYVSGDMYFTTAHLDQGLTGATFVAAVIDEPHDPALPVVR